jgi:hypothetical protein
MLANLPIFSYWPFSYAIKFVNYFVLCWIQTFSFLLAIWFPNLKAAETFQNGVDGLSDIKFLVAKGFKFCQM